MNHKKQLYLGMIIMLLCFVSISCNGDETTLTPALEEGSVEIESRDSEAQLIIGVTKAFDINVDPPNLSGQVNEVTLTVTQGIECAKEKLADGQEDKFTWHCTAREDANLGPGTIQVSIIGSDFALDNKLGVEIVAPVLEEEEVVQVPPPDPEESEEEEATQEPKSEEDSTLEPNSEEREAQEPTPEEDSTPEPNSEEEETIEELVQEPEEDETETPACLPSSRLPIDGPDFEVTAEITTPENCGPEIPAATSTDVAGIFTGDLEGLEFWVLVYISGQYWPQSPSGCEVLPAEVASNRWLSANTFIGAEGDEKQFELVLTVTEVDSTASKEFKRWLGSGCETGEYPPYTRGTLPDGLTELDATIVKTSG